MNWKQAFSWDIGHAVDRMTDEEPKTIVTLMPVEVEARYKGKPYRGIIDQMRMDFEVPGTPDTVTDYQVFQTIYQGMKEDLIELVEHGDVTGHRNDAWLKGINGAVVRGVEPNEARIAQLVLYPEYKHQRAMMEYTVYFLLWVDWPDND